MRRLVAIALIAMAVVHAIGNIVVDGEFEVFGFLVVELPLLILAFLAFRFGPWATVLVVVVASLLVVATGVATADRLSQPGETGAIVFAVLFMIGASIVAVAGVGALVKRIRSRRAGAGVDAGD